MIIESIQNRRSVYPEMFNQDSITKQELETLIQVANYAPNHVLTFPWRFMVFHSVDSKVQLGNFLADQFYKMEGILPDNPKPKRLQSRCEKSAAVVAVLCHYSGKVPAWEETAATAMAVQNIQLCAYSLKIGMYWGTPDVKDVFSAFQPIHESEKCLGFLFMGKYDDDIVSHTPKKLPAISDKMIRF